MPKPTKPKTSEVTVIVYVDGKEYVQLTNEVEAWAVPYVVQAACVQVDEPDYAAATDALSD